jgi:NADH-quinone oxidoreductase subunit G
VLRRARLVVLDHQMTPTAERAEVVLPAATFAEGDGTLINMEGRAQRYFQNFDPAYTDRSITTAESWRWLGRLRGGDAASENLDAVLADCEEELPQFEGVVDAAPDATFRIHGMSLARAPHRQSGRTAARAVVFVHEPRSTQDTDTPLTFSMEGYSGVGSHDRPPELLPFAWAPGWNSPQEWNKFQAEVGGALRGGDPGVHLFEASRDAPVHYFAPKHARADSTQGLRVVPLYEHFGSEELSSRAAPIRARMPASYLVLNADDAKQHGIADRASAVIGIDGEETSLTAYTSVDFPRGYVGLPVGLERVPVFVPGAVCTIRMGA